MANRMLNPAQGNFEKALVNIVGKIVLGADASVQASTKLRGASAAKTGTGLYTITLEDSYPELCSVQVSSMSSVTNANGGVKIVSLENSSGGSASADFANVKKIVIATTASTGAATDGAVAAVIFVDIKLKNTTVKY